MKMDPGIKRLRWVMIATLLGDLTVTFAGQPASYWRTFQLSLSQIDMKPFLSSGAAPMLLATLFGVAGLLYTVTVLPKKWSLMLVLAVTLTGWVRVKSLGQNERVAVRLSYLIAGKVDVDASLAVISRTYFCVSGNGGMPPYRVTISGPAL